MKNETTNNNSANIFYRNNYRRLFRLLMVMVIGNLILIAILIYLITHIPQPRTFASTSDGGQSVIYPLDQPVLSQQALLEWANQAAISIYNLDYLNYEKQLANAAHYFTPRGWRLFQNNFNSVVEAVVNQKLRVGAVAVGAPVIIEQGPLLGNYSWRIRMPLLVTYESATETKYQRLMVDMVIMRVSTLITPKGIAIAQFYAVGRQGQLR